MGRKGPRAKTKIVLKSVSKVDQLGSMPNLKFQTFLNKNPPSGLGAGAAAAARRRQLAAQEEMRLRGERQAHLLSLGQGHHALRRGQFFL